MRSLERRNLIRYMVQSRIGMTPRARKRKWRRGDRAVRLQLGHCVDCNKGPAMPDKRRCEECDSAHKQWGREWYAERIQLGLCQCRQRPVVEGRTLCGQCAERNRIGAKARRDAKRAAVQP